MNEKNADTTLRVQQAEKFGDIELDISERDSILLWQKQGADSNVVFIERTKLNELIQILNAQLTGGALQNNHLK